jgi:23S rRNA (adenine2503-C2)-methyltransferase
VIRRYDATRDDIAALLDGEPAFRARQVWDGLYRRTDPIDELTDLPLGLRERLAVDLPEALTPVTQVTADGGDTVKWLWGLEGGARIETVLMHYDDRSTVCISTQAGCAMACSFCATGQAGFERQLSVGEVVEQVIRARRVAAPRRVSNVVFMGMGEPLANYDNTWAAVERLHGDIGLSARHITISTVGLVPGIRRLAEEDLPVNLAVSLHLADDDRRNDLVPINRRYPLAELAEACRDYLAVKNRRLSFEWALIDGVNDAEIDAVQLAAYARPLHAHVNLIPLNPTPGYPTMGSSPRQVRWFRDRLRALGVNATVRQNRGTDIDAACGQLRAGHEATPVSTPRRRVQPMPADEPTALNEPGP